MNSVRHSLRLLRKSLGFSAVTMILLALGIGANTAIFSLTDAWLIRPLHFRNPDRLMIVLGSDRKHPVDPLVFEGYRILLAWKDRSRSFEDLGGLFWRSFVMIGQGEPEQFRGMAVTADFFRVLGVQPELGRTFAAADENGPPVAVLSHSLWTRSFGASKEVIGRQVTLNSVAHQVVGVMPADFDPRILNQPRLDGVWTLLRPGERGYGPAELGPIAVVGRLKPGVSPAAAQAELGGIQDEVESRYTENMKRYGVLVTPLQADNTRTVRATLLSLAGLAGFVLLITCINVAALLTGRAPARARELAVRAALGAGRRRLVAQMLAESLLLSAPGAALGVLLAGAAVRAFQTANPLGELPANAVSIDARALAFATGLTLLTTLLFGLVPALHASRLDIVGILKAAGSTVAAGPRRTQGFLLVGQVALTTVVVAGAFLMTVTLWNLQSTPLGFQADSITTLEVVLSPLEYNQAAERAMLFDQIAGEIRSLAGVRNVTFTNAPPLYSAGSASILVEGESLTTLDAEQRSGLEMVGPNYFSALAIPILKGRSFTEFDNDSARPVVILNELAARIAFHGRNPLGQRIRLNQEQVWREIVGISGNVRSAPFYNKLEWDNNPRIYLPYRQGSEASGSPVGRSMYFYVQAERAPSLDGLRGLLGRRRAAIAEYRPLSKAILEATRQPRLRAELLAGFAAMALLLAAIGIYGVTTQAAHARMREIGIRIALGAGRRQVLQMVVRRSVTLAGAGASVGVILAAAFDRMLSGLLYGISPVDPLLLGFAAGTLVAVAGLSSFLPARRASAADPASVLRQD